MMATNLMSIDRRAEVTSSPVKRPSVNSDLENEISPSKSDEQQRYWPTDVDLERLLSGEEDSTGDQDAPQAGEAESDDHPGSALDRLVASWAEIAVSHAAVRYIDDPSGHVATVAGIEGAWGFGDSEERALDELRSVLIGWACLKLEDGDDDIPSMEGVHLVVKR